MYAPGETVGAVMRNVGTDALEIAGSFCRAELQSQQPGGAWRVAVRPAQLCTLELRYLAAGQSAALPYRLPQGLPSGVYRIEMPSPTTASAPIPDGTVVTPPFTVAAAAPPTP